MMFPLDGLDLGHRQLGLLLAVAIGVGFGFVLERSGFGRAQKLVGQFYLHDMTVFKVMFSGIVTAMLGLMVLGGLGVVNVPTVLATAASETFIWPMLVGGLVLGAGFIISGYCPGTSLVATASGKIDGLVTVAGVIVGSVLFSELRPLLGKFPESGALGQRFLDQVTGIPRPVLGLAVAAMAISLFFGAEKVEALMRRRAEGEPEPEPRAPLLRNTVFAGLGALAVAAVATLALPGSAPAGSRAPRRTTAVERITSEALAHRLVDAPWTLRVLDLRPFARCAEKRVPGAECVPAEKLADQRLGEAPAVRDLVIYAAANLKVLPAAAVAYRGRVLVLRGGFEAWTAWALVAPTPPTATDAATLEAYRFRAAFHQSVTGVKAAPPALPSAPAGGGGSRPKKKGGGCG